MECILCLPITKEISAFKSSPRKHIEVSCYLVLLLILNRKIESLFQHQAVNQCSITAHTALPLRKITSTKVIHK